MAKLFYGGTFHDMVQGYALAKYFYEEGRPLTSYLSVYKNGIDLYNGKFEEVTSYCNYDSEIGKTVNKKTFNKESFELFFKDHIEAFIHSYKREERYRQSEIERKARITKIKDAEMNFRNRDLKRSPTFYQSRFMNLYYVFNSIIYQVIKPLERGKRFSILVEAPSGKEKQIYLSQKDFENKEFFLQKSEAIDSITLIDEKTLSSLPKRTQSYIKELKKDVK